MIRLIYVSLALFLSVFLTAQNDSCVVLKTKEIISIQMKFVNPKNATLSRELFLKPKDILVFADKWNNLSPDTTTESPKPKYFFFVTLKNKKAYYFAVSGNQITDKKCFRSSPDNAMFFDKLWDSLTE